MIHCNSEIFEGFFWKNGCRTNCSVSCICAGGYSCWKCKNVWLVLKLCSVASFSEIYTVFLCLHYENVKRDCVKSISEGKIRNSYFPSHLQYMIAFWIEVALIHVIFQVLIGSFIILITWKSIRWSSLKFNDLSVLPFLEKEQRWGLLNTCLPQVPRGWGSNAVLDTVFSL